MKKVFSVLNYYALLPFAASIPGLVLSLFGWGVAGAVAVPVTLVLLYLLFRKRIDLELAARVNGWSFLMLTGFFTVLMILARGSIEGRVMSAFNWIMFPYAPIMLILLLMGKGMLLIMIAILTYGAAFLVCALLSRTKRVRYPLVIVYLLVCLIMDVCLYQNRPAAKYAGHGFNYMHGFSSTDFTDYQVYSTSGKLAVLDHEAEFTITDPEEMPVMDGAEACYPLYAAFAKAVYKDIDQIEKEAAAEDPYYNGKIVTFTNTIYGFSRLVRNGGDREKYGDGVDLFFGARPSEMQEWDAKESRVELEITPIGREAFVFFVEADNPITDLTADQVRAIYHGDITNWQDIGGKNQRIVAFQRPNNSGSQTMMTYFMGDVTLQEPKTYEKVDAMMGVINEVAQYHNEAGAIGYSFRYFLEELNQEKGVRMLSIDGVAPTVENIENGSYPFTTDVCLITRKNDPNPNVRKMIDFILSEDGQELVRKTGYGGL